MPNQRYRNAIASIESGGNYNALGPVTSSGDRAYGKYQVMGANIGPWTEKALGRRLTKQEFLASPEAQDRVFDVIFGEYVQRFGPSGAAQAWFAGPGSVGRSGAGNRSDQLGTTVESYVERFNRALGGTPSFQGKGRTAPPQPMPTPTNARERLANFITQAPFANRLQQDKIAREAGGTPILDRMKERRELRSQGRKPILEEIQKRRQARGLSTPLIDRILSKIQPPSQTASAAIPPPALASSQPPPAPGPERVSQPALTGPSMFGPGQWQSPFAPNDPRAALMGLLPRPQLFT